MQTKAEQVIANMQAKGHTLLGRTSGTYSFRKGSNLSNLLIQLGKREDEVIVELGARAGKNLNDGHQLLVFSR